VAYDPPTDRLTGVATISATATQNLSRFNLDFVGLTVRSIKVNGRAASWSRTDHELMVTPRHGLPKGHRFTTGQFDTHRYRTDDGLWMYDALDPDLFDEAVDPGDPASATFGGIAQGSFARQDEILNFLERRFSRYPFSTGGGIIDDYDNIAVYFRGAMAVHTLRQEVGDRDFFRILHAWTTRRAGGNGTIPQFIRLAEQISGEQLDDLFQAWLFTGSKPALEAAAAARASASPPAPSMELMRR